jgi:hypothetical protein
MTTQLAIPRRGQAIADQPVVDGLPLSPRAALAELVRISAPAPVSS